VADKEAAHELAVCTAAAVVVGGAGLLGPDAGAAAQALQPALETVFSRDGRPRPVGVRHAAETLEDAAEAAGEPVEQLAEKAVSDERREELLARTLTIAQDTSLGDKRRALGRALAAGIAGDAAKIDDELLFVRAIADIDTPHIRLLARMAGRRTGCSRPASSRNSSHGGTRRFRRAGGVAGLPSSSRASTSRSRLRRISGSLPCDAARWRDLR
jgi:hypothetical protein